MFSKKDLQPAPNSDLSNASAPRKNRPRAHQGLKRPWLRQSIRSGVGKLFTRRATFEKILKPRAVTVWKNKKRSTRPHMYCFLLKINVEQKKGLD